MKADAAAVDQLVDLGLRALEHHEPIAPTALTLLVRRYAATGREDLGSALGSALARALETVTVDLTTTDRPDQWAASSLAPEWIWLFLEAAAISDDGRLSSATAALVSGLHREWPLNGNVGAATRSIDACMCAAHPIGRPELIAGLVDELERVIGLTYRPGLGVMRTISASEPDAGSLFDQASAASALLTAYSLTGRLPYSMLAEELLQVARRRWWDGENGGFSVADGGSLKRFVWNCDAARVLCRLAALRGDREYQEAALVAVESDYAGDAARTLSRLESANDQFGLAGAVYGLALIELDLLT